MEASNDKKKEKRNPIKRPKSSNTAISWTIRSVENDRRAIILKAAEDAGKTIGQFMNEDITTFCMGQISHTKVVSAPKDIENQFEQIHSMIETLFARLPEIPEQGKKSLWKRIFP